MSKERNTRRTFGFSISGHSPPIEPKRFPPSTTTISVTNTCPITPPYSLSSLPSTTLSPFAAALPGTPPYECITKRTFFPFSIRCCSDSHRIDVASIAAVAVSGLLRFKEGSGRQWVSKFELSRMVKTLW